jgi:hypothetical protein
MFLVNTTSIGLHTAWRSYGLSDVERIIRSAALDVGNTAHVVSCLLNESSTASGRDLVVEAAENEEGGPQTEESQEKPRIKPWHRSSRPRIRFCAASTCAINLFVAGFFTIPRAL